MGELRTSRLLLRDWREDDLAPFATLNADPEVMAHLPAALSREQSDAIAARIRTHLATHRYGLWAVEVDGVFAGFTGLQWTEVTGAPELELGWRLARPFWGHGYATEAAQAALEEGLRQVPRLISVTASTNTRSWRVMERLGMTRLREFDSPLPDLPARLRRHLLYVTG